MIFPFTIERTDKYLYRAIALGLPEITKVLYGSERDLTHRIVKVIPEILEHDYRRQNRVIPLKFPVPESPHHTVSLSPIIDIKIQIWNGILNREIDLPALKEGAYRRIKVLRLLDLTVDTDTDTLAELLAPAGYIIDRRSNTVKLNAKRRHQLEALARDEAMSEDD